MSKYGNCPACGYELRVSDIKSFGINEDDDPAKIGDISKILLVHHFQHYSSCKKWMENKELYELADQLEDLPIGSKERQKHLEKMEQRVNQIITIGKTIYNAKDIENMHDKIHELHQLVAIQFGEQQCPFCELSFKQKTIQQLNDEFQDRGLNYDLSQKTEELQKWQKIVFFKHYDNCKDKSCKLCSRLSQFLHDFKHKHSPGLITLSEEFFKLTPTEQMKVFEENLNKEIIPSPLKNPPTPLPGLPAWDAAPKTKISTGPNGELIIDNLELYEIALTPTLESKEMKTTKKEFCDKCGKPAKVLFDRFESDEWVCEPCIQDIMHGEALVAEHDDIGPDLPDRR